MAPLCREMLLCEMAVTCSSLWKCLMVLLFVPQLFVASGAFRVVDGPVFTTASLPYPCRREIGHVFR